MLKKLNEKKNNKGFSLVELIVVILIMAVLAVAVAPQVMKWVGRSRQAADRQSVEAIVSGIQLAAAQNSITSYDCTVEYKTATHTWEVSGKAPTEKQLDGVLGTSWKTQNKIKDETNNGSAKIEASGANITISGVTEVATN